jgi:hypothetical protein
MKQQGRADHSGMGSTKREPIPHAVSVPAVSEIGIHQVRGTSLPLYEGRGLEAPMAGSTTYESGSQGKHK